MAGEHARCEFCALDLYSPDELFEHMRDRHFTCQVGVLPWCSSLCPLRLKSNFFSVLHMPGALWWYSQGMATAFCCW